MKKHLRKLKATSRNECLSNWLHNDFAGVNLHIPEPALWCERPWAGAGMAWAVGTGYPSISPTGGEACKL